MLRAQNIFDSEVVLAEAQAGRLTFRQLRRAIKRAEDLGKPAIATELRLLRIHTSSFADDASPDVFRVRLARGVSLLLARGAQFSRTLETLKRMGALETVIRYVSDPGTRRHLPVFRDAQYESLSPEAIVLDHAPLFNSRVVNLARKRLAPDSKE